MLFESKQIKHPSKSIKQETERGYFPFDRSDIVWIVPMAWEAASIVATVLYPQIKTDLWEMKAQGYFLRVERRLQRYWSSLLNVDLCAC